MTPGLLLRFFGIGLTPELRASMEQARLDVLKGIASWRTWLSLGAHDIRIRYRRTKLGPIWITLSMAVTFIVMGMVFSAVLKVDVSVFLPWLAAGMLVWGLIAGVVNEAPMVFVSSHHIIAALRIPFSVHVMRMLVRNIIVFSHNLLAFLVVYFVLDGTVNQNTLYLLVGMPLLCIGLFFAALLLATLGARFRDVIPMITVAMQLLFFTTPIIWKPENIAEGRKYWIDFNPVYHMIEIVREPILGQAPELRSLIIAVAFDLALAVVAYLVFRMFRRRIAYWL